MSATCRPPTAPHRETRRNRKTAGVENANCRKPVDGFIRRVTTGINRHPHAYLRCTGVMLGGKKPYRATAGIRWQSPSVQSSLCAATLAGKCALRNSSAGEASSSYPARKQRITACLSSKRRLLMKANQFAWPLQIQIRLRQHTSVGCPSIGGQSLANDPPKQAGPHTSKFVRYIAVSGSLQTILVTKRYE